LVETSVDVAMVVVLALVVAAVAVAVAVAVVRLSNGKAMVAQQVPLVGSTVE
jgi:hypothetical protein